jgi:hypothetical protein
VGLHIGWTKLYSSSMSATDEAIRVGIDLRLMDESLRLTPEQRAIQHKPHWRWLCNSKRPIAHANMTELNRLLQKHCDADIDFVIVGGFAAMLHGSFMLTRDL